MHYLVSVILRLTLETGDLPQAQRYKHDYIKDKIVVGTPNTY